MVYQMARWSSGLRLRPLTPATAVRIRYGSPEKGITRAGVLIYIVGVDDAEGPPVPIPNTVVKLSGAENTWLEAARENRETPTQTPLANPSGHFALIAQSVEHAAVNRGVTGSSPVWGAK